MIKPGDLLKTGKGNAIIPLMSSIAGAGTSNALRVPTNALRQKWRGLSGHRKRKIRHITPNVVTVTHRALSAAISAALTCPRQPLQFASSIARAADISFPPSTHATLIRVVAAHAENEASTVGVSPTSTISNISTNNDTFSSASAMRAHLPADVATEAFIRLWTSSSSSSSSPSSSSSSPSSSSPSTSSSNIAISSARTTPDALVAVAELSAHDPFVERRGLRAASVLRFTQHNRTLATLPVYKAVFDTFVEALDFQSALTTLTYAHAKFSTLISDQERAHWYDRLIYAALVRKEFSIVDAAFTTKQDLGLTSQSIPMSFYCQSLSIAYEAEQGSYESAVSTAQQVKFYKIEPFAFASLIRAAGARNDVNAIMEFYKAFENQYISGCRRKFIRSLSPPTSNSDSVSSFSLRTSDVASTDPTQAVFLALRACKLAEQSVSLVKHLQRQYAVQFSTLLYSIISDTCFKANRMKLAVQVRKLMQKKKNDKLSKPGAKRKYRSKKTSTVKSK